MKVIVTGVVSNKRSSKKCIIEFNVEMSRSVCFRNTFYQGRMVLHLCAVRTQIASELVEMGSSLIST
jgi:hypothetical protein